MANSEYEQLARAAASQGGSNEPSEREREMEEVRQQNLDRFLSKEARSRLQVIKMVKASQARQVEDAILQMVRMGQIRSQVSEKQLLDILEGLRESKAKEEVKIIYNRKGFDESDDEEYDL
ncbi:hypothetical protein GGH12_004064 [Coemansia sp. RSA 1822]|nr:hypothetical protein LPJ54_005194 [Coemansia sp. RSA 1824]KAJ1809642.1 hypothetical protein LPJ77_001495 [Coemansia sp. RSA 2523]KAJ1852824.1 hypothetical protein LPJ76_005195 [Coemansia sp. RSA 638]KAJ2125300.1 hypothetical protein IW147_000946 [Coemansia sp. RSA 720]KAJ2133507.1 hypothetical protein GGF48_000010 [Coemansia sp. RSA 921]KAJ2134627.1 hypothetical protein GGH17_002728 [Coemansia sp. RSA 788]KAJ2155456.1 hypothetical protein J3F82_000421 [Coemansia sp. RSA 637]KAJ2169027.1 h